MIDQTVSHYRVLEKIGSGGMGEVYQAEDTRLGRVVALKFLPWRLSGDPEARERFRREARVAAARSHAHIVAIHDIGEHAGRLYIAMEYVGGRTLKEIISDGADLRLRPEPGPHAVETRGHIPLPIDTVISIASQIAAGLQAAHEAGVVHRDIKPGNIMVDPEGQVKILDFGLAKLAGEAQLTGENSTWGTARYMSPEQAMGREVDPRTDIWSMGVVLYEMLTGRPPFRGEYEQAVIYSILNSEPEPLGCGRPDAPEALQLIVARCLQKAPGHRYPHARALLSDLQAVASAPAVRRAPHARATRWLVGLAALAVLVAALAVAWRAVAGLRARPPLPVGASRQVVAGDSWLGEPALSPDGTRIAYAADIDGNRDLMVTDLLGGNPLRLTETPTSDHAPAWFPDGGALAFAAEGGGAMGIWKIGQLGGGATLLLPEAIDPAVSPDGNRMAFAAPGADGYLRIGVAPLDDPAKRRLLTGAGDGLWNHRHPTWSPDGKTICYDAHNELWLVSPDGGRPRPLAVNGRADAAPSWSGDGRFVYFSSWRGGALALWRIASGGGRPEGLTTGSGSEHHASVARDGSRLAYSTLVSQNAMVVRDLASGRETRLPGLQEHCLAALAADGSRAVYADERGGRSCDLWIQPLREGTPVGQAYRLTREPGTASCPAFTRDGRWIAYYSIDGDQRDIFVVRADGGEPVRVTDDPAPDIQPAWSPDGRTLAFVSDRGGRQQIWLLPVRDGRAAGQARCRPIPGLPTALEPNWSPDGTRIALVGCTESANEAWVMDVAGEAPARRVTSGADVFHVRWHPDGGELLVTGTWGENRYSLRRVDPVSGAATPFSPPILLGPPGTMALFDITADGRYLLLPRENVRGGIWLLEAEKGTF